MILIFEKYSERFDPAHPPQPSCENSACYPYANPSDKKVRSLSCYVAAVTMEMDKISWTYFMIAEGLRIRFSFLVNPLHSLRKSGFFKNTNAWFIIFTN